jgi:hypothetical protein
MEEQAFNGHQEMSDGHERASQDHRTALPHETVREHAAEERSEVDKSGVETVNPGRPFLRELQVLDHVVDQQRSHPVVGKPLPHFREKENIQSGRMVLAFRNVLDGSYDDFHGSDNEAVEKCIYLFLLRVYFILFWMVTRVKS